MANILALKITFKTTIMSVQLKSSHFIALVHINIPKSVKFGWCNPFKFTNIIVPSRPYETYPRQPQTSQRRKRH